MFCFFVSYFPVIKKLSSLFFVCRIIQVSFQLWEHNIRAALKISVQCSASRVQSPASSVQSPESSVQRPASRVQRPESSVQSPASSVQSPASRVQRPEPSVQLLRPESRNSGMPDSFAVRQNLPIYLFNWFFDVFRVFFCNSKLTVLYGGRY